MRASDAGWLLQALSRGGAVELGADQEPLIDAMANGGLIRKAPDPRVERTRLDALKLDLARISGARSSGQATPDMIGRERGLRTAILELSEHLADCESATEVRLTSGGGPYRGAGQATSRWQLTQKGRTLLSDLAPRVVRMRDATVADFEREMNALREAFTWRAQRAAQIASHIGFALQETGRARLAVPVGLSAARGEPQRIARAFEVLFLALRRGTTGFSPEQDAAAAEALCVGVNDLARCEDPRTPMWLHGLRIDLMNRYAKGQPEDAMDAAMLVAAMPDAERQRRIALAAELGAALRARGKSITLPLALIATAGDDRLVDHMPITIANLEASLAREVPSAELTTIAVLLSFPRGDVSAQVERWRALRQYLARFAPEGMAIAAALLSWIALEPAEVLDDLRLASAALSKHRLVNGGAETMTLATKLLVGMAVLAAGREGDHEERLALAPIPSARLPQLGLHASATALPLAGSALVAFHRVVLDATAEWESQYHPTHSSYVFGGTSGRRRSSWG